MKYLGPELHPSGIHSAHHSRANSRQHHRHHHRHHHHHHGKRRTHEENQSVSFVTERPKSRQVKLEDHHNELMIDDLFDDKQFCKRSQHQVSLFFSSKFFDWDTKNYGLYDANEFLRFPVPLTDHLLMDLDTIVQFFMMPKMTHARKIDKTCTQIRDHQEL